MSFERRWLAQQQPRLGASHSRRRKTTCRQTGWKNGHLAGASWWLDIIFSPTTEQRAHSPHTQTSMTKRKNRPSVWAYQGLQTAEGENDLRQLSGRQGDSAKDRRQLVHRLWRKTVQFSQLKGLLFVFHILQYIQLMLFTKWAAEHSTGSKCAHNHKRTKSTSGDKNRFLCTSVCQ